MSTPTSTSSTSAPAAGVVDIAALGRIQDRLKSTSDDNLPPILINLIPKIIPLTNNNELRAKAVEIITESLRRAKVIKCKFPFQVLVPLVHPKMLPFASNFGIAFLDSMYELDCVIEVDHSGITTLLDAILTYNLYIHQSNALLYYTLQFCVDIATMLDTYAEKTKVLEIVGDYYLDFMLLQHLNIDDVGAVQAGLSEKRIGRLKQKKKQFALITIKALKLKLLDSCILLPYVDSYHATLLAIIASIDNDKDVSLKGKQILNRIKDNSKYEELGFMDELLTFSFNWNFSNKEFGKADRTNHRIEIQNAITDYIIQNFSKFTSFNLNSISTLVDSFIHKIRPSLTRTEANDHLLTNLFEILQLTLRQHLYTGKFTFNLESEYQHIVLICKTLLPQFVSFTNMSPFEHQQAIKLRGICYEIIQTLLDGNNKVISNDVQLIESLLNVAEKDEFSANTTLFKLLNNLREVFIFNVEKHRTLLLPTLTRFRSSNRASCRLVYLQWMQLIENWNEDIISTMLEYAEDIVEIVSNYAFKLFQDFEKSIITDDANQLETLLFHSLKAFNKGIEKRKGSLDKVESTRGMTALRRCIVIGMWKLFNANEINNTSKLHIQHDLLNKLEESKVTKAFPSLSLISENLIFHILEKIEQHAELYSFHSKEAFRYMDEEWSFLGKYFHGSEKLPLVYSESISTLDEYAELLFYLFMMGNISMTEELSSRLVKLLRSPRKTVVYNAIAAILSSYSHQTNSVSFENFFSNVTCVTNQPVDSTYQANLALLLSFAMHYFQNSHDFLASSKNFILQVFANTKLGDDHQPTDNQQQSQPQQNNLALEHFNYSTILESCGIISQFCDEQDLFRIKIEVEIALKRRVEYYYSVATCYSRISIALKLEENAVMTLLNEALNMDSNGRISNFAIGENIIRLCQHGSKVETEENPESCLLLKVIGLLISAATKAQDENLSTVKKVNICVILLTSVKYMASLVSFIPFHFIENILAVFLVFLRTNDGYLQDLSSLGLCYLYESCGYLNTDPNIEGLHGLGKYKSVQDFIAQEIGNVVTRRKRPLQPLGYDAAGRGITVNSNNTNQAGDTNRQQTNNIAQNNNLQQAMERVMNGNEEEMDEVLEAAAAMAATELNASMEGTARTSNLSHLDPSENGYGAYGKICSIARKGGDSAIIILVISLVKCDPSFGKHQSFLIGLRYQVPSFTFDKQRIITLIPFLYMAKFDPIASVRDIINSIWLKFVGSEESIYLKENEKKIIHYLASNVLNPSWREREAACLALDSILLNKQWIAMKDAMEDLVCKGLKVMDDLRESTRKVATNLMKTLFQYILRASNPSETDLKTCQETVAFVLPILIDKGIVAASLEARGFSLGMLLKLIEQAGTVLKPWLVKLIDVFLESISALEPQMLNYIQFHTHNLQVGSEEWEKARVQISQHSPMHQGLKKCLQLMDIQQIPAICNTSFFHLQSGVGLATRVAAADTLADIAERYPSSLGEVSGKALHAIGTILIERPHLEKTLKKAMLNTFGLLAKVIHVELLIDECYFLLKQYMDRSKQLDDPEFAIASCILEIVKRSGDRIQHFSLWNEILTVCYIGSFDNDMEVSKLWSDALVSSLDASGAGTKFSAIHRCIGNFAKFVSMLMLDNSWEKRKQSIRVVNEIITHLSQKDIGSYFGFIVFAFLLTIPGSIWNGQHLVLDALADIFKKAGDCFQIERTFAEEDQLGLVSITIGETNVPMYLNTAWLIPGTDGYDLEAVKQTQDSIRLNCLSVLSSDEESCKSTFAWSLDPFQLLNVLHIELNRGDLDYRISAANVYAALPWNKMVRAKVQLFESEYSKLREFSDLFPKTDSVENLPVVTPAVKESKTVAPIATVKKSNNASFLFGNRYGAMPTATKPKKILSAQSSSTQEVNIHAAVMSSTDEQSTVQKKEKNIGISSPAFRMYMLDILTKCCKECNPMPENFVSSLNEVLRSIKDIIKVEAWSLKRSALQLNCSIAISLQLTEDRLNDVVGIIEIGANDAKYVKVKATALETLREIMQSLNRDTLKSKHLEKIRSIARNASLDSQPSILEEASKLQQLLLTW